VQSAKYLTLIFLILFPSISNAAYKYIEITSTKDKNQLWIIKSKLNNMNLGMLLLEKETEFVVYTGPFRSNNSATTALNLIKPIFHNAHILGLDVALEAETIPIIQAEDMNESNESTIVKEEMREDNYDGFFIGIAIGIASAPYEHTTLSGVVVIDTPAKYNFTYSLEGGYLYKNNLFLSLEYLRTNSNDISTDNIIGSFGYKYELELKFTPYFSILAGQSILQTKTIPLYNPQTIDKQSQSFIRGFGLSVVYDAYDEMQPYLSYQYIIMDHTASLESSTGSSKLEHKRMHNIQVGIRF